MSEQSPTRKNSIELPFSDLIEGIEVYAKEALDFGNKFLKEEIRSGRLRAFFHSDHYLPSDISFHDNEKVFAQYVDCDIQLNPKRLFKELDSVLDLVESDLNIVQLWVSLTVFHELGHHLHARMNLSQFFSKDKSLSENGSDFISGYILYKFIKSRGMTLSEGQKAVELDEHFLRISEMKSIAYQAETMPEILNNKIGPFTSIQGHGMYKKRTDLVLQGIIDSYKERPLYEFWKNAFIANGENVEMKLQGEELELFNNIIEFGFSENNRNLERGYCLVGDYIDWVIMKVYDDNFELAKQDGLLTRFDVTIKKLVDEGYLRKENNRIYLKK